MGDFRQREGGRSGGYGGGRPSFGRGRGRSNDGDRGPVTKHQAVCDQCGKECEVPFRPTGGKPIYCDSCFQDKNKREDGGRRGGGDRYPRKTERVNFERTERGGSDELKKQLEMLNAKMDQLIKVVESMVSVEKPAVKKEVEKKEVKKEKKAKKTVKAKETVKKVSKKSKE